MGSERKGRQRLGGWHSRRCWASQVLSYLSHFTPSEPSCQGTPGPGTARPHTQQREAGRQQTAGSLPGSASVSCGPAPPGEETGPAEPR